MSKTQVHVWVCVGAELSVLERLKYIHFSDDFIPKPGFTNNRGGMELSIKHLLENGEVW